MIKGAMAIRYVGVLTRNASKKDADADSLAHTEPLQIDAKDATRDLFWKVVNNDHADHKK
jgi:hypothetical protein